MQIRAVLFGLVVVAVAGCGSSDNPAKPTPPKASPVLMNWTFDSDMNGWSSETSQTTWGTVQWTGLGDGMVKMDGIGYDGSPNGWMYREIDLPSNAALLRFDTSPHDRGDGAGSLRVRLVDANGDSHTLLDWEELHTDGVDGLDIVERKADISAYAGQTVTLYFDHADIDGGANNQRYVDNIEIRK